MEKHRFSDAFQIYMTLFQSKKTKVGLGGADGEEEPKTRGKKKKNNGGKEGRRIWSKVQTKFEISIFLISTLSSGW